MMAIKRTNAPKELLDMRRELELPCYEVHRTVIVDVQIRDIECRCRIIEISTMRLSGSERTRTGMVSKSEDKKTTNNGVQGNSRFRAVLGQIP